MMQPPSSKPHTHRRPPVKLRVKRNTSCEICDADTPNSPFKKYEESVCSPSLIWNMNCLCPSIWIGGYNDVDSSKMPFSDSKNKVSLFNIGCNTQYSCPIPIDEDHLFVHIDLDDTVHSDITDVMISTLIQFLFDVRKIGGVAFVHCMKGISRSPSCVIAALAHIYNMTFENVYSIISGQRRCIELNAGFLISIKKFCKTDQSDVCCIAECPVHKPP